VNKFRLSSSYQPTGDQPRAIAQLVDGLEKGQREQTLLGVTGSGKTFTMANIIAKRNVPTLVLAHNKTLAAQLFMEFKEFFPENAVEYFVSYYDYYQPEAYIASTGTYIEKDLSINEEVEKLRLSATASLLSGRRDVLIVASVSCIYGIGNPTEFNKSLIELELNSKISRTQLLHKLVNALYSRTLNEFSRGTFRVKGDVVDVFPAYADSAVKIQFFGDEIEKICNNLNNRVIYRKQLNELSEHDIDELNAFHMEDIGLVTLNDEYFCGMRANHFAIEFGYSEYDELGLNYILISANHKGIRLVTLLRA